MNLQENGFEIIPGRGLGSILFGMPIGEVENILGRAAGASVFDGGEEWTLSLHYPGMDMFFDQSDDFRLSVVEVDQECPCRLFGEPLFPRSRRELIDLLRRNSPDAALKIEERIDEDLKEVALNLPALQMTFYFNDAHELEGVNWAIFIGSDDKAAWPYAGKKINFTFVTEKAGSTTVEQVEAPNFQDAVLCWHRIGQTRPGNPSKTDEPTPIRGVNNVWCIAGHDAAGVFYLAHVIATFAE